MKLDLINYRADSSIKSSYVFDSSSESDLINSNNGFKSKAKGSGSFLLKDKSANKVSPAQIAINPIITNKGDYFEIKEVMLKKDSLVKMNRPQTLSFFDIRLNPIAKSYITTNRPRVDTPCMNRILNKSHPIDESNRRIPGGKISLTGLENDESNNDNKFTETDRYKTIDYDILRWEKSKYGKAVKGINFDSYTSREKLASHIENPSPIVIEKSIPDFQSKGKCKFSKSLRRVGEIKQEPYVKTNGLILDPYYDWKSSYSAVASGIGGAWCKKNLSFDSIASRDKSPTCSLTANIEVKDVDCAQKMTMATYSKYSPITYSSAFRSKANQGCMSKASSLPDHIGPGYYINQDTDIHHIPGGLFNKRERGLGFKILQNDNREIGVKYKSFAEENTAGIHFKVAGVIKPSRTELAVRKVYPKLAQNIYDKIDKIDLRNMKDTNI